MLLASERLALALADWTAAMILAKTGAQERAAAHAATEQFLRILEDYATTIPKNDVEARAIVDSLRSRLNAATRWIYARST